MTSQHISVGSRLGARLLRGSFPLLGSVPKELRNLSPDVGDPAEIHVPTRHGDVRCLVYRPPRAGEDTAPVYVEFHGGAFIVRAPEQDDHLCRYLAAHTGAVVLSVDYDTAPSVRYPVAEQQAYDVAEWAATHGDEHGWDGERLAAGGMSAGSKLAINVCQQARESGVFRPVALVSGYGAMDMTLTPPDRTSPKKHPAVAPWLLNLMYATYFPDVPRRRECLASPSLDDDLAGFPPTLIMTAELDVMAAESDRFAAKLSSAGVTVTHERFPGVDHGFTHDKPVEVAVAALDAVVAHLRTAFAPVILAGSTSADRPDHGFSSPDVVGEDVQQEHLSGEGQQADECGGQ
ncbi:alpha/beta hydrolase [Amycolatopsis sp. NPDC048633]|uniref:alpha/beta hydrolase n=1 Tax=Amycolatopsis sp. NPDC048633 TaxID=3157095 RepID=UPI0033F65AF7